MSKYAVCGAAGAASSTAATAGLVKVESAGSSFRIYEWSVCPGAAPEDTNYAVELKRQTTAGTWTSVTPAPLDPTWRASNATAGRASTAAGTASTVLGIWGFNQRAGFRWVSVPGGEYVGVATSNNGIILEYLYVSGGTAVNYATIQFEE